MVVKKLDDLGVSDLAKVVVPGARLPRKGEGEKRATTWLTRLAGASSESSETETEFERNSAIVRDGATGTAGTISRGSR